MPSKSNKLISKATKAGLYKEKILKDVTNKVVGELNTTYQKEFRVDFVTQAKKYVPEFAAVKPDNKKLAKDLVKDIENQYHETWLKRQVESFCIENSVQDKAKYVTKYVGVIYMHEIVFQIFR